MRILTMRRAALAAAFLSSTLAISKAQLDSGLLNYWRLDGDATDSAGAFPFSTGATTDNGNINGTVTFVAGQTGFGQAGNFPGGGGNNITVLDSAASSTGGVADDIDRTGSSVSISVWVKVNAFTTDWQGIVAHGENSDYRIARREGQNWVAYAGGTGDIYDDATGTDINDGNWHHIVAITEHNVGAKLYVDGALEAEATDAATSIGVSGGNNNLLCIGCNPDRGREWDGLIDDVAMWDRALSEAEVITIYDAGVAASPQDLGELINSFTNDTDGDGLIDDWEIANLPVGAELDNGLDPNNNGVAGNPDYGAAGDPDNDLSDNLEEYNRRTLPQNPDTDMDGYKDGIETNDGTFDDILTDTGTDPRNDDTDGDGLKDGVETNDGSDDGPTDRGTHPLIADTDDDAIPDGQDIAPLDNLTPATPALPFTDDFDDNAFDFVTWKTNLDIPGGAATVTEQNERMEILGRAHLVTRGQYDPDSGGGGNGLAIRGEFTYGAGDFFQVLTQSDGVPDPAQCCGETQNGVEFFVDSLDGNLQIRTRGANFTVSQTSNDSVGLIQQGETFEFQITDDGTNLTFQFVELDNPGRRASVSGEITADTGTENFIVFHNREGNRLALLDNVSIYDFRDTDLDTLPDWWEVKNGLNETDDGTIGESTPGLKDGPNGAAGDPDGDLLTNGAELAAGTDADEADSDCDTLSDYDELNPAGGIPVTNPSDPDSDNDSFSDSFEIANGTNPDDIADFPTGGGTLPFSDDFEDKFINPLFWNVVVAGVPGAPAVTEKDGKLNLIQRGYLLSKNEFDPADGGLVISGEWTFAQIDEYALFQILTQSDGVPVGQYGETQEGVEFWLRSDEGSLVVRSRNDANITVTQTSTASLGALAQGTTLAFEITDDGTNLSFTLTEVGNETNTATVTGTVDADSVNRNHIVFHNREYNGRIAQLDNVSISRMTPEATFAITDIGYDSLNDEFTLTWSSQEGRTYAIFASQDAINWDVNVDDAVTGTAGTTSFGPFANPFTANPGEDNEIRPDVVLLRVEDATPIVP